MKKTLLMAFATGALASTAQAQSTVTAYGIMDASVVGGNQKYVANNLQTKSTAILFTGAGAENTSRLGFRGVEDLGGGLSALFTIEVGITPDSTAAISTASTQNRQTFVGLKKEGVGNFAIGTQFTPMFGAVAVSSAAQTNNMIGDVIYSRNYTPGSAGPGATGSFTANDNNLSFTARIANALTLNTEKIGGFQGHAILVLNNQNSTQATTISSNGAAVTGGVNNQNGWGLGADYTYNKLFLTGVYQSFSATNPYAYTQAGGVTTFTTGAPTIFGVAGANTLGTNVHDNQGYVGATYDFGILKAYANWVTRKATDSLNSSYYVNRQAEQIGVRGFITPTIESWAVAGLGSYKAYGQGQPTANFNAWQLGVNYWLSKRTNLYAIVGVENTSNYSTVNTSGVATGTNSANQNGYAIGVRHTF